MNVKRNLLLAQCLYDETRQEQSFCLVDFCTHLCFLERKINNRKVETTTLVCKVDRLRGLVSHFPCKNAKGFVIYLFIIHVNICVTFHFHLRSVRTTEGWLY